MSSYVYKTYNSPVKVDKKSDRIIIIYIEVKIGAGLKYTITNGIAKIFVNPTSAKKCNR